uniref:Transmembrane protein n=1 Tax=Panagrellus redivivus TaxID=6233 RepID=A0A7E4ZWF2_PANRE
MALTASWILLPLFIASASSVDANITANANQTDTTPLNTTTEKALLFEKSLEETSRDAVATSLSEQCRLEPSEARMYHIFFYTCMYDKAADPITIGELEKAWSFCCGVQKHCPRNVSVSDCRDIYCDCLDLVNAVHQPLRDSCKPKTLPKTCDDQTEMSKRRLSVMSLTDVGFAKTVKKNLILGSIGWGCFLAVAFVGLASISYTVISFIHFKCHKPTVEAPAAAVYEPEVDPAADPDENNLGISNSTHTVGSANSLITTPVEQQQPKSNGSVETVVLK